MIIDSTICEEGVFSPNPFINMVVELNTGTTYTQTKFVDLITPWKSCAYATPKLGPSPLPSWISSSYNSATKMITINVLSTDLTLKDTSALMKIVLTASIKNSDNGMPLDPGYTFTVLFKCTVTSLILTTAIPNTSYALG